MSENRARVIRFAQVKAVLGGIDWSFSSPFSVGRSGLELFDARKYHWYPATFVPEIPYTLIELLSEPGASVYDPFLGLGTTLFQALSLGRNCYGTEVCRVAIGLVKAMWTLSSPATDISSLSHAFQDISKNYNCRLDYSQLVSQHRVKVEKLRPWYEQDAFNQLMYLAWCETRMFDPAVRSMSRIVVSATLKSACAQDRGWGCISDNVLPKEAQLKKKKQPIQQVTRRVKTFLRDLHRLKESLPPTSRELLTSANVDEHISRADTSISTIPEESVDLIITSPPYPNMTDYSLAQRLSYYWLGYDPSEDLQDEIGARRKRSRQDSIEVYTQKMKQVASVVSRTLKDQGYLCLVMPVFTGARLNDTSRQRAIETFIGCLPDCGLVREHVMTRVLPTGRRHHNQEWTTLAKEEILIFRRAC